MTTTVALTEGSSTVETSGEDEQYKRLLLNLDSTYQPKVATRVPVYTTDAEGLFDAFLDALPADRRQHYNCDRCRAFVTRFGGLVTLDGADLTVPLLWDLDAGLPFFQASIAAVHRLVVRAKITGVFLSSEKEWGVRSNVAHLTKLTWHHMSVLAPETMVFGHPTKDADQIMAERREDRRLLERALQEFPVEVVRQAHLLLTNGTLYRSEACEAVAQWFLELHVAIGNNAYRRNNIIWRAVATAPAGFAHVRSTMIGTLLEDLAAGKPFEAVKGAFDAKMDPTKYQRPTAAPSDGQLAQAEKIVSQLQAAGALDRRFAKLEDLKLLWKPQAPKPAPEAKAGQGGGVFEGLKGSRKAQQQAAPRPMAKMPTVSITWSKFVREVLPNAESMTVAVPATSNRFFALVTAVNPQAPPILQWDSLEERNPVSWYFPTATISAGHWNLTPGEVKVTGVTLKPSMWAEGRKGKDHGNGVFFLLDGARDVRNGKTAKHRGGGYFPEILRGEFHEVRKTMEAHANRSEVVGADEGTGFGIAFSEGRGEGLTVTVQAAGTTATYRIDRWD